MDKYDKEEANETFLKSDAYKAQQKKKQDNALAAE
jgi:hypothetical protein